MGGGSEEGVRGGRGGGSDQSTGARGEHRCLGWEAQRQRRVHTSAQCWRRVPVCWGTGKPR